MAKFIKSIFTPEKRKGIHYDDEIEGETESPPLDERRKLSMSRSGRLKQSYKKRQQLSVDVYGGEDLQATEKPKSVEYHVNTPILSTPTTTKEPKFDTQRNSMDNKIESSENDTQSSEIHNGSKSPEEEIDNAFEIIDKS